MASRCRLIILSMLFDDISGYSFCELMYLLDQFFFFFSFTQSWSKISRQIYSGTDKILQKNPVLQQRIQQVSQINVFLCTIHFRLLLKQFCVVDIAIPLHERLSVSKSGHINIDWREGKTSA